MFGCQGERGKFFSKETEVTEPEEEQEKQNTKYVKNWGAWFYAHEEDLGKRLKEVKDKLYMEFGSKVYVLEEKIVNQKVYNKIQLPDKSLYWVDKDALIEKFIVITKENVLCYKQPDTDYADTIQLQPGDFGLFIKEIDGWVNAEFLAYRPAVPGGDYDRVGNKWINSGYTEDLKTAKEAYYLNLAYYYIYSKDKSTEKAVERLEKAMNINVDTDTEITYVVQAVMNDLSKEKEEDKGGKVEIITLNPDEEEEQ